MAVNRYTQLQSAAYNPLSMQEMSVAPSMMRQKHDQLNEYLGGMEGLIEADPLDEHVSRVAELKNQTSQEVDSLVDELNKHGYSPTSLSSARNLNRKISELVSPTGEIGQINAAKKMYKEYYDNVMEHADDYGKDNLLSFWSEHVKDYTGFDEDGKIQNISEALVPKYRDLDDSIKDAFTGLGETTVTELLEDEAYLTKDSNGNFIFVDKSGKNVTTSNAVQAANAMNRVKEDFTTEGAPGYKSARVQNLSEDYIDRQITYAYNSRLKNKQQLIRNSNYSLKSDVNAISNGTGITESSYQYAPVEMAEQGYGEMRKRLNDLYSRDLNSLTPEEKKELNELESFTNSINEELSKIPGFNNIVEKLDNLQNKLNSINDGTYDYSKDLTYQSVQENPNVVDKDLALSKAINLIKTNTISEINKVSGEADEITKELASKHIAKATSYTMSPRTPKQTNIIKTANENISTLLKSSPQALSQFTNIEEVILDGKPIKITSQNDKDGISELFFNSEGNNVELISVIPEGLSGYPEYTLRLNTKKDSKGYDLDNPGLFHWRGKVGEKGEPLTIKVSFKEDYENSVTGNINAMIQEYLSDTGSVGQALVDDIQLTKAYRKYEGFTWKEVLEKDNIQKDPYLRRIYLQELKELGITKDSKDSEFEKAVKTLEDKTIFQYE